MDTIYSYALTTLQRVKDILFDPNQTIAITGTTTNGSPSITSVTFPSTPKVLVGQAISGPGIPFGTLITAVTSNSITINKNATADGTGAALSVINQPVNFDTILTRMINSVTDFIELETGSRRFAMTLYTNDIYSAYGAKQRYLPLRQSPVFFKQTTCNTVTGNAQITGIPSTNGMQVGMPVQGDFIPAGAVIASVDSSSAITLKVGLVPGISPVATGTSTGSFLQVSGLIRFQWRAGTPSTPNWTDFIYDQYELVTNGKAGIIRIYGVMPRLYDNMARVTYAAGFLIDWAHVGDPTYHTLPSDLTSTAENLVVRKFKRRQLAGKTSEALEGATTAWNKELDNDDLDVFGHWKRISVRF